MRRRRLRYRAAHRGTRELDLILGTFAEAKAEALTAAELDRFERLLNEDETSLQQWLLGQETPPPTADLSLIDQIIAHKLSTT